jgi:cyclase
MRIDRRTFVHRALASSVAAAVSPAFVSSSWAAASGLSVTSLGNKLSLIGGAGGNVVVFDSPAGVLMVDGGSSEYSKALLQKIKDMTQQSRVHTLINTHWHWEQTGSNLILGKQGTRIVAHENTRLWLNTIIDCQWRKRRFDPLPKVAQPNHTFYTHETFDFGTEKIECGHLFQAHTDGDIYAFFRNANVLVVGDIVSVGTYPIPDYTSCGWIGGLLDASKQLIDLCDDKTQIIAGTGPVLSKADLVTSHAMLATMKTRLSKLLAKGMSAQEMIDTAPSKDFDPQWGDPKLFIQTTWHGLVPRARELGVSIV